MTVKTSTAKGDACGRPERVTYAVETVVDRTTREQCRFLDYCVESKIPCTLFSMAGKDFSGIVHRYDRDFILFGGSGANAELRLFPKSNIAMLVPDRPLGLFDQYAGLGTALIRKRQRIREAKAAGKAGTGGKALKGRLSVRAPKSAGISEKTKGVAILRKPRARSTPSQE